MQFFSLVPFYIVFCFISLIWTGNVDGNLENFYEELEEHGEESGYPAEPREYFRRFDQLGSTNNGSWPDDFYRVVLRVCQDESLPGKMHVTSGCSSKDATIAVGRYRNAQNESGWGILEIETFANFPPQTQAYAAGLVEGALTKGQISNHYRNTLAGLCKNATEYCRKLYGYLGKNLKWIQSKVFSSQDIYWRQVNLTFMQLTGINDGFERDLGDAFSAHAKFSISRVYLLQLLGEFYDLDVMFGKKEAKGTRNKLGHCSALVKLAEDNRDILIAHNTMAGYNSMNRIVKLYKFGYDADEVPGNIVAFSGYPAVLASQDDYTMTSAGLLSLETTIDIFNVSLYHLYVRPEGQLHCWLRSFIANQLASTAHDWVKIFARHNSGTYNNQWTVVDYKLFKPGHELPNSNLVWVLEQVPGTCVSRDCTWFLRNNAYWPSYNIPFFSKISQLSGYSAEAARNNWWSWQNAPRARIFRRDHHKVKDIGTLRALLRYNDYKHDEFSRCQCNPPFTADASIATRGDLNPPNGTWEIAYEMGFNNFGTLDYKGTNYALFGQMRFELIGGPTFGGPGNLPIFSWSTTKVDAPHFGQPTDWNFSPFITRWQTTVNNNAAENA